VGGGPGGDRRAERAAPAGMEEPGHAGVHAAVAGCRPRCSWASSRRSRTCGRRPGRWCPV
jgi:hypothetical protein